MQVIDPPGRPLKSEGGSELSEEQLHTSSPCSEAGDKPTVPLRPQPSISKAAALVAVYVLLALVVTSLCERMLSTLTEAGLSQRRLAGSAEAKNSEDAELDHILSECLDLELETGRLPSLTQTQEPEFREPFAKKARLMDVIRSTVSSFEASGHPSPFVSGGSVPTRSYAHSSLLQGTSEVSPVHQADLGPGWKTQVSETSRLVSLVDDGRRIGSPAFDPQSRLQKIPAIPGDGGGDHEDKQGSNLQGGSEEDDASLLLSSTVSNRQARLTSSCAEKGLESHPFVRLPRVLPDVTLRAFRPNLPINSFMPSRSASSLLMVFRAIFAKRDLDSQDADDLMRASEALVRYACTRITGTPVSRTIYSQRVRQLGLSFLLLDAIVCARQLLGEHMLVEEWWSDFSSQFFTDYPPVEKPRTSRRDVWHNYHLEKNLRQAVELLKTGVRPRPKANPLAALIPLLQVIVMKVWTRDHIGTCFQKFGTSA
ncbi:hypothetical protein Efla_002442 [Eimeria flavescens]